jgi:hypothetical protein
MLKRPVPEVVTLGFFHPQCASSFTSLENKSDTPQVGPARYALLAVDP